MVHPRFFIQTVNCIPILILLFNLNLNFNINVAMAQTLNAKENPNYIIEYTDYKAAETHTWIHHQSIRRLIHTSIPTLSTLSNKQEVSTVPVRGQQSNFELVFHYAVPETAKAPLQRAVQSWADVWKAPDTVTIMIEVAYAELPDGVLGAAQSSLLIQGDGGLLRQGTSYTSAMAKSITGDMTVGRTRRSNVFTSSDVRITFNSKIHWNYDSRKPTDTEFDLETVALHEIGHGLYFDGSLSPSNNGPSSDALTFGYLGDGLPSRYDEFMTLKTGVGIVASCTSSGDVPEMLYDAATSPGLFFYTSRGNFTLYSPTTFSPGSSVYHIVEDDDQIKRDCRDAGIDSNDCSDLMSPALPMGYRQHSIGLNTLRILDMMLSKATGSINGTCIVPPAPTSSDSGGNDNNDNISEGTIIAIVAGTVGAVVLGLVLVSAILVIKRTRNSETESGPADIL
eukprot:CAMPEP_0184694644 /NCGR_PEP_ID=MMETSP0313-20130426/2526_1 /TAXON_ID=2792 /ORGANISM="Porphyridium aerugineum, Strain SAG 1380-2" /LENGTH=451 /DNA_ID=CAMNT_0027152963 /DNA_START=116 /DNA_END=1471 /DNA_ORIENTATION=+